MDLTPERTQISRRPAPTCPPPRHKPILTSDMGFRDINMLRNNKFGPVFMWLKNDLSFWFVPISVGLFLARGYKWDEAKWISASFALTLIESFY